MLKYAVCRSGISEISIFLKKKKVTESKFTDRGRIISKLQIYDNKTYNIMI